MSSKRRLVSIATATTIAAMTIMGLGGSAGAAPRVMATCTVPSPPDEVELTAHADISITVSWSASKGAATYDIYRGTKKGGEGKVPIARSTGTSYRDRHLSTKPIYFYQIAAVNSCGRSARSSEEASKTPPPIGTGGNTPGVPSGKGWVYYCKDALLAHFDWFEALRGWFPQVLYSARAISPRHWVVDMAYSELGTMTFKNVAVPKGGLYTVDWRYAFNFGAFPGVRNREMGLAVNGQIIATAERFPITGNFNTYRHSYLQVRLLRGKNVIVMFAVSHHGVPRLDEMTITPATASVPGAPSDLTATAGTGAVTLKWTASTSGNPTSYAIYRGTISGGEANTPVATVSGTTTAFTDTGLKSGTTYFYYVAAFNRVGPSPDSNEVSSTALSLINSGGIFAQTG